MGARTKKKASGRASPKRRKRAPPPRVKDAIYGVRCRVVELHYLEDTLELMADTNGARFTVPIDALVGPNALSALSKGASTWLSVRLEDRS